MAVLEYTKEGRIAIFTINRPEALNALNLQVNQELSQAMLDFRDDDNLWVGIITGSGDKAFCAGADIKETLPFMKEHGQQMWAFPPTHDRGMDLWKPLIAAINGFCLGGGLEIALGCDIRIVGEKARLALPEVTLGLIPGDGGTQRLPRHIPRCKAAEILLMGKMINAQEAYRIGLVNIVVPPEQVMATAKEWAETICKAAPLAVRAAKQAMVRGCEMTLEDGLRLEYTLEAFCSSTEDFTEGTTAFVEKRKPVYKGK
ncbi:enoyl-CoA hydratase/isomerase family protein [Chloroflexota bacterium]